MVLRVARLNNERFLVDA